jgi:hypothetical protein
MTFLINNPYQSLLISIKGHVREPYARLILENIRSPRVAETEAFMMSLATSGKPIPLAKVLNGYCYRYR